MYNDNVMVKEISEPRETAKMILENTDNILNELNNHLKAIFEALSGGTPTNSDSAARVADKQDLNMLDTLRRQRDLAEDILKVSVRIREVLW